MGKSDIGIAPTLAPILDRPRSILLAMSGVMTVEPGAAGLPIEIVAPREVGRAAAIVLSRRGGKGGLTRLVPMQLTELGFVGIVNDDPEFAEGEWSWRVQEFDLEADDVDDSPCQQEPVRLLPGAAPSSPVIQRLAWNSAKTTGFCVKLSEAVSGREVAVDFVVDPFWDCDWSKLDPGKVYTLLVRSYDGLLPREPVYRATLSAPPSLLRSAPAAAEPAAADPAPAMAEESAQEADAPASPGEAEASAPADVAETPSSVGPARIVSLSPTGEVSTGPGAPGLPIEVHAPREIGEAARITLYERKTGEKRIIPMAPTGDGFAGTIPNEPDYAEGDWIWRVHQMDVNTGDGDDSPCHREAIRLQPAEPRRAGQVERISWNPAPEASAYCVKLTDSSGQEVAVEFLVDPFWDCDWSKLDTDRTYHLLVRTSNGYRPISPVHRATLAAPQAARVEVATERLGAVGSLLDVGDPEAVWQVEGSWEDGSLQLAWPGFEQADGYLVQLIDAASEEWLHVFRVTEPRAIIERARLEAASLPCLEIIAGIRGTSFAMLSPRMAVDLSMAEAAEAAA